MNYVNKSCFFLSVVTLLVISSLLCNEQTIAEVNLDLQGDQQREEEIIFDIDGVNTVINNACRDDAQSDFQSDQDFNDEPDDPDADEQYGDQAQDNDADDQMEIDADHVQLVPDPTLATSSLSQEIPQENNESAEAQDSRDELYRAPELQQRLDDDHDDYMSRQQQAVEQMQKSVDHEQEHRPVESSVMPDIFVDRESQKTVDTRHDYDLMDYIYYAVVKVLDNIKTLFRNERSHSR